MDPYIKTTEELFSAARSEFKHMKYYYFHNFIYENVWEDNSRRTNQSTSLIELEYQGLKIKGNFSPEELISFCRSLL